MTGWGVIDRLELATATNGCGQPGSVLACLFSHAYTPSESIDTHRSTRVRPHAIQSPSSLDRANEGRVSEQGEGGCEPSTRSLRSSPSLAVVAVVGCWWVDRWTERAYQKAAPAHITNWARRALLCFDRSRLWGGPVVLSTIL